MTKFSSLYRETILPAGLLSSVIIGAGMFALPFVFSEAGFAVGASYLAIFAVVFTVIHLMYADVILNTPGQHRFVGYAEIYLKKWGFWGSVFTTAIGFILVLTAYIVLARGFLELIYPAFTSSQALYLFWGVGSLGVMVSLRRLERLEFVVSLAIGVIILTLFGFGAVNGGSAPPLFNAPNLFVPYGIVLFSLGGRAAISSLWSYYKRRKIPTARIKQSIVLGTITPAFLYIIFALAVFWLSGGNVSADALSGLILLPQHILVAVGALGVLALWTSYLFLGIEVRDIFRYDFRLGLYPALAAVTFLPIALYLAGMSNFIQIIGIVGGVFGALESIMVILMYKRINGGWGFLGKALVLVFALGIFYQLFWAA